MGIALYEHNRTAYEAALAMLGESGKAAIVHPTGTGKSFIAFKLCEDFPEKTVCWLSPSEYIFRTQLENLREASNGYEPKNIQFYTYARLMHMTEDELEAIGPDYIVLDEFHRCGAEQWGVGVRRLLGQYPGAPILGLSATNIRYLDNQRDMADELFDGNVASEITLGEAIVRGILNPPKYVLSVYSYRKDLKKYERRVKQTKNRAVRDAAERYLEALRRALDKAEGLDEVFARHMPDKSGKYIVFCANKEHMDGMMEKSGEWFSRIDRNPHIYSVYSDDPTANESFEAFKADNSGSHLRLLFCIDALNEGVHVEDVSGVILLRPTVSPIIYKQQIGRALSASKRKDAVIFDIVLNIENLYSIGAVEEEMRVAMTYYRSLGRDGEIVNEQFRVIDEVRDCRELFERLNDTLTASWETMYGYAKAYNKAHGDLNVQRRYKTEDGYALGNWIFTQRKVRGGEQYGKLDEDRIAKLDEIGMVWDNARDTAWNRYFAAAEKYSNAHGGLAVPVTEEVDGIPLGCWIANLRTWRKSGIQSGFLTRERIEALDRLGMVWSVPDYLWERNYNAALEYHREHGNLQAAANYVDKNGFRLGAWLQTVCAAKRKGGAAGLTEEQLGKLEELGLTWEKRGEAAWRKGYAAASAYYRGHGDLDVPAGYRTADGYKLGGWIGSQREKYRAGKLAEDRFRQLDELGMIWAKEDPWEARFALAEAYYKEHGDLNIPARYNVDGVDLSKWVNEQKQAYRGKRKPLTAEQVRRLEAIGMDWRNHGEAAWERRYEAVRAYYEQHHDLDIPPETVLSDGRKLGEWLAVQRQSYKKGKLSQEQIGKLNALGMNWKTADPWEIGFSHAMQYAAEHGNLMVPSNYVCSDGYRLGSWINNQRSSHNRTAPHGYITAEQEQRLEQQGMLWSATESKWDEVYAAALAYYRRHRNLDVPHGYKTESGADLHEWLRTQRVKYRKGALSKECQEKLNGIGIDWLFPSERSWENYYAAAEQYYAANGHLRVPITYRTEDGLWLGRWVEKQRTQEDKLKSSGANGNQIARLGKIGMVWQRAKKVTNVNQENGKADRLTL